MNRDALKDAEFRKARNCDSKSCVEIAMAGDIIGVRDSKDHGHGPVLAFTRDEWAAFLGGARKGEFDLP